MEVDEPEPAPAPVVSETRKRARPDDEYEDNVEMIDVDAEHGKAASKTTAASDGAPAKKKFK
jgi:hypothetical protein